MNIFQIRGKTYQLDLGGFLTDYQQWDEDFAEGMAALLKIPDGLNEKHWEIIDYIRNSYEQTGTAPLLYQVCRVHNLHLRDLKNLFPTGYLRRACKLAGITYREGYLAHSWLAKPAAEIAPVPPEKTYEVDVRGFLTNPEQWDEQFAAAKAFEMKTPHQLTEKHWQVIHFLRDSYRQNGNIPTVYDTCEANQLELEELEELFPDGYHRGAIKIAGLRVR